MTYPVGFAAHHAPRRLLLLAAVSLVFVAAGMWMAGLFGAADHSRMPLIGWIAIVFFGACAIGWIARLFDRREQLSISAAGIRFLPWSGDTIPWSEIEKVSVWEYKGTKTILLHLVHPWMFPSRTVLGKLAGINKRLTGGDISINVAGLDCGFNQVMAAITRFR